MCFYTSLFFLLTARYNRGPKGKKSYSNILLSHFLSFYRSRPRPLASFEATCIDCFSIDTTTETPNVIDGRQLIGKSALNGIKTISLFAQAE